MYILNNISLDPFGFIPGQQPNSNLALSGFLDAPARLGKTFHDWADENGVEPYVSAEDILIGGFGSRQLNLVGGITGSDRNDCEFKRKGIEDIFNNAIGLMPLQSKWGVNNVLINGPMTSAYVTDKFLSLSIPMLEPFPDLSGVIPVGNDSEFGIDGISFRNLGGIALELSGDRRNRPAPKPSQFTAYAKPSYGITNTVAPEMTLRIFIEQPTYQAFKGKINGLSALILSPGMRYLTMNNDKKRSFFAKDGFSVDNLYSLSNRFCGVVTLKLTESGVPGILTDLIDVLGNVITYQGNVIQIRI